jgi:tetratricopeptide (TPR) repeat protein
MPSSPGSPRSSRRSEVAAAAALGLLTALALFACLYRVPEGAIGASGGRLREPGWHFRTPFGLVRLVPLTGRLEALDVERRTPEGAALTVRMTFDYSLRPERLASRAADLEKGGLEGLASRAAAGALDALPPAASLPGDLSPAMGQPASLTPRAREAIDRALRDAGIEPASLVARVGPAGSFPKLAATVTTSVVREKHGPREGAGGGAMPAVEETGVRLLLIGLDGADWRIIDPLLAQGRLPNLAQLIGAGARGPMRSYDPMISPLLWTTMATGVGPDVHGVADFQAIDPASGRRVPITSRFRRVKAIWNILGDAGRSSAFVAWWASYPAEKVSGVQVSNLVAFQALRPKPAGAPAPAGITFPADYYDRIRPSLITAADLPFEQVRGILHIGQGEFEAARREVLKPPAADEESENRKMAQRPVPLAIAILTGSRNYATIAADLATRRFDLTAVYFEGIDMMGHRFQHCMPPRLAICPPEDFARFRDAVTGFYLRQDALIGDVLAAAGPGTTVMVVSDHGFKSGAGRPNEVLPFTTQQPVEWHREEGIFILSGPTARAGQRLRAPATLFDVAPTLLYLLGLPVAEDMPGRVLLEAIDPGFARGHPARRIPSYEPLGSRPEITAAGTGAEEAERELLASLRALGYIGGDADAPPPGTMPQPGSAGGAATPGTAATRGGTGAETQVFYHRNLATYLLKRKDYARAAEQLRLANERQKLPKTYQMLSEAYSGMGKPQEALAALEEGLASIEAMDPESVLWMVQICLSGTGGREAATDKAKHWTARTATKPGLDAAIAGLLQENAGDLPAAVSLYHQSLSADPSRVLVAQRITALEGPAGAPFLEPLLRRALAKDPRIDEYHNLLGGILAGKGRMNEAAESFRQAADLDASNPRFAANLAGALARLGRWEEAAAGYETAATLAPSSATYMKLGSVYRQIRRPEQALQAFEKARELGEGDSGPLLGIALARAEMNQIPEALAAVREGLDRHPEDRALRSLYDDLLKKSRSPGSAPGRSGSGR